MMMKRLNIVIHHCGECPYCVTEDGIFDGDYIEMCSKLNRSMHDIGLTRVTLHGKNGAYLSDRYLPPPDCPLPDCDKEE